MDAQRHRATTGGGEAITHLLESAGHLPEAADLYLKAGLTERAAKEKGIEYRVGKFSLKSHGKAIADGAAEGMVKLIVSKKYGEILGGHIIGQNASELIHEICVAKALEGTVDDIIATMHAHPTMAESMHEAALGAEGRMIHG
jgi:dihydrolipoamide dehydrogenase